MNIKISVRALVEFMLRGGNIDNRIREGSANSMQEGSRIHRMIQKRMGPGYEAEVSLSHTIDFDKYSLTVEGRADGIFTDKTSGGGRLITIDEIKSTYRAPEHIKKPVKVHLAQAKCYAAIYAIQNHTEAVGVRMSYCNVETEEIKYFSYQYTYNEIITWFDDLTGQYKKWSDFKFNWLEIRAESIHNIQFPYSYRKGQKELAAGCYRTIFHGKKLFLQAPTGTGKTITTVFPAIKAIGEGKADRLFYLTAKTITRTVAEDTISLLRSEQGLKFKSVTITARDKICMLEKSSCNPSDCEFAKGHYDRINDAIYDLLTHEDSFDREKIVEYAVKHTVCPFEFSLDMSLFSDGIICDYNYLFDPFVYLRRFFSDNVRENYIFLVDEAHNLLERGRDMYSAELLLESFEAADEMVKGFHTGLTRYIRKCAGEMEVLELSCRGCTIVDSIDSLSEALERLSVKLSDYLDDHSDSPIHDELLQFYFDISRFLTIYDLVDDKYVIYSKTQDDGTFMLKLYCVDPSGNLAGCFARGKSAILFSATFLPIQYYKKLLGGTEEDYELYAESIFDPDKCGVFIEKDVTSRYTARGTKEYRLIASSIHNIVSARRGNYLVFFPSHAFLENIYSEYSAMFPDDENEEIMCQGSTMTEESREDFLCRFSEGNETNLSEMINMDIEIEENRTLMGFCVMGGIFGEGIDLKNDSLIGVIVVGTGIPQVCEEREILKSYFDQRGDNGFDFAYRYPGMNKVLQAAGRVIRTETDTGIIALLDDRFMIDSYKNLFPREWKKVQTITTDTVNDTVNRFWSEKSGK